MDVFIHWAGFVGAWLLVAGPLLQAAIELRDEELDREGFESAMADLEPPPKISAWWWLLPPVAYVMNRRRNNAHQKAVYAVLAPEQRAQFVGFMNKARGWFSVAAGAFLIALKETWELVELYELPGWLYAVAIVVLSIGVVSSTVVQLSRSDGVLHADDPDYAAKRRTKKSSASN